jgi:hypothetical protein
MPGHVKTDYSQHPLLGRWRVAYFPADETDGFICDIRYDDDTFKVEATSLDDGEELEITSVEATHTSVEFNSRSPSADVIVHHCFVKWNNEYSDIITMSDATVVMKMDTSVNEAAVPRQGRDKSCFTGTWRTDDPDDLLLFRIEFSTEWLGGEYRVAARDFEDDVVYDVTDIQVIAEEIEFRFVDKTQARNVLIRMSRPRNGRSQIRYQHTESIALIPLR